MIVRTCPGCAGEFKRCKKIDGEKTCPKCGVEIFYSGSGETILLEKKVASRTIVSILERHISVRDGINFIFEGACLWKELKLAYSLIDRAEAFLARQVNIGLTALEFCIEIVDTILSDKFWSQVTKSIAMFMKHVSDFAAEVFLKHKDGIEEKDRHEKASSFADFLSYGKEGETCYQAVIM